MHPALRRLHPALLLPLTLSAGLLLPTYASAATFTSKPPRRPTTNPVALALKLAERYWHGAPACGTPMIRTSSAQLPSSAYESTTSPEPKSSIVEMWTETQKCTITINASLWPGWHQDDEFFQWFCDAMTHEVGHRIDHLSIPQLEQSQLRLRPRVPGSHAAIRLRENSRRRSIPQSLIAATICVSPAAGPLSKQPRDACLRRAA
jgi:hypothetical protein